MTRSVVFWEGLGGGHSAARRVPVTRKRRTLVAESGAWNQSDSFRAEDFGHVPEGFVELEIS